MGKPESPSDTSLRDQVYESLQDALTTGRFVPGQKITFGFKPTNEIRSYGQLWGHVANFQYDQCAQVKGVPPTPT